MNAGRVSGVLVCAFFVLGLGGNWLHVPATLCRCWDCGKSWLGEWVHAVTNLIVLAESIFLERDAASLCTRFAKFWRIVAPSSRWCRSNWSVSLSASVAHAALKCVMVSAQWLLWYQQEERPLQESFSSPHTFTESERSIHLHHTVSMVKDKVIFNAWYGYRINIAVVHDKVDYKNIAWFVTCERLLGCLSRVCEGTDGHSEGKVTVPG